MRDAGQPSAVSYRRDGAPHNALWFGSSRGLSYVNLDEEALTQRTLSFAGYVFASVTPDLAVFAREEDPHEVLFYSLRGGYGARTRVPLPAVVDCTAHSYAFFFTLSAQRHGSASQLCALVLETTPPAATAWPPLGELAPAALPFVATRVLSTHDWAFVSLVAPKGSNAHGPLISCDGHYYMIGR